MIYLEKFVPVVGLEWQQYKESDIIQNIKDICLELQDDGFTVTHEYTPKKKHIFFISKGDTLTFFKFDQISEVVERIVEYLEPLKYHVEFEILKFKSSYWDEKTLRELKDNNYSLDMILLSLEQD